MTGMEVALMVASTAVSTIGAISQANAAAQAAEYNAAVARQEAAAEEARRRREAERQMGQIRAGRAKSGVTVEGSPLIVLADSAMEAEIDALNARWTGETSAKLYKMEARSARRAGIYNAGASLLSGASKIAGM